MMNFSFRRVGLLVKKDISENKKSFLLKIGLMYGVIAMVSILISLVQSESYYDVESYRFYNYLDGGEDPSWDMQMAMYGFFFTLFGCLSAASVFENMKNKTSRLSALMVPATMLEKYISRLLLFLVTFVPIFLFGCLLGEFIRYISMFAIYHGSDMLKFMSLSYIWQYISDEDFWLMVLGVVFWQSVYTLGSSIWPKNSFLKTFVAVWVILLALAVFLAVVVGIIFDFDKKYAPDAFLKLPDALGYIMTVGAILFNYTLAYFRLKESEIIHRM